MMGNDWCEGQMRERRPQIILSIAQETEEEIVRVAKAWGETHEGRVLYGSDCYDIVEWRADHFAQVFHFAATRKVLLRLRQIFSGKPILFTFRTGEEGGEKEASTEVYFDLNKMVCESGLADFIDVEAFAKGDVAEKVIAVAHQQRVKVIASHHDFVKTPAKREICRRLLYMEALEADILKIAYRSRTGEEVLRLMDLARKREASGVRQPLIALSMGEQPYDRRKLRLFCYFRICRRSHCTGTDSCGRDVPPADWVSSYVATGGKRGPSEVEDQPLSHRFHGQWQELSRSLSSQTACSG